MVFFICLKYQSILSGFYRNNSWLILGKGSGSNKDQKEGVGNFSIQN